MGGSSARAPRLGGRHGPHADHAVPEARARRPGPATPLASESPWAPMPAAPPGDPQASSPKRSPPAGRPAGSARAAPGPVARRGPSPQGRAQAGSLPQCESSPTGNSAGRGPGSCTSGLGSALTIRTLRVPGPGGLSSVQLEVSSLRTQKRSLNLKLLAGDLETTDLY